MSTKISFIFKELKFLLFLGVEKIAIGPFFSRPFNESFKFFKNCACAFYKM